MKYKIIKSKNGQIIILLQNYLSHPVNGIHLIKNNHYIEHQDVFGTSKTVLRRENRVTIISNLAFYLLRIKGPQPQCVLFAECLQTVV